MKNKLLYPFVVILLYCKLSIAQNTSSRFYFVTKNDTVFCDSLRYGTTSQGYLNYLEYVDLQGKHIKKVGRESVPEVLTFYLDGVTTDKLYTIPDKPSKYTKYIERIVDGKLRVYLKEQGYSTSLGPTGQDHGPIGLYKFYIKMPDGTFYQINDSGNMKNYIRPYLLKCKEFASSYTEKINSQEEDFIEAIKLYNSLCAD